MDNIKGYTLVHEYDLRDIKSKGYLFRHDKSGARVAVVSNDDNNKVFSIGFRTPPKDSTGVAHIVEHTVLCGSRKFRARDSFVELAKGSLNTFLNAMTYPDKTVYPVASCNDKDFANLMDVYLDSVLFPNIYKNDKVFMQEGWHYELNSADSEITYKGVVYNEMKGAFSSPDQVLYRTITSALFPDTTYGIESGGDPEFIPDLTYEQFLEFHKKYYHPSNSYIYLYGDMDVKERLEWMDKEYLSLFDKITVDSEIELQKPFDEMREIHKSYPVVSGSQNGDADVDDDGDDTDSENADSENADSNNADSENAADNDDKTYLAFATSFGKSTDSELCIAFDVLSYVLVDAPGAPLKQKLLDKGIGREIICDFESEIRQPVFSIVAKASNEKYKDEFVNTIKEELAKQVRKGFDSDSIEATLTKLEFKYREADYERFPKGLVYGLDMFAGWLYDDNCPFDTMQLNSVYESLRNKIGTGYYEEIVDKYILNNTHCTVVVVSPDKEMGVRRENELKEKLAAFKASLTSEQIDELVKKTEDLLKFQQAVPSQEDIDTIPMLSRDEISRDSFKICNEKVKAGQTDVIWHDIYTNEIVYSDIYFNINDMPLEFVPYLSLYSTALGYFNTTKNSYGKLAHLMNMCTGGLSFGPIILEKSDKLDDVDYMFKISTRFMYYNGDKAINLISEIITETDFNDEKHLREVIREMRSRMETKLNSASHLAAVKRSDSYYSQSAKYSEILSGISYYDFLVDIDDNFEEKKNTIIEIFNELTKIIFRKEKAIISLTCDDEGKSMMLPKFEKLIEEFDNINKIEDVKVNELVAKTDSSFIDGDKFKLEQKNEGYKFAGQVQYVARTGNFMLDTEYKYTGAFSVLRTALSYGYLWETIREKGGAYGCMSQFAANGNIYFVSYRDPALQETNEAFEKLPEYVAGIELNDKELTKYVIGTIGALDYPLNPNARGCRDFALYYKNKTYEQIKKIREQIIDVTVDDLRKLAPMIRKALDMGNICVIGNEMKIEECKDMFKEIKTLE